MARSRSSRVTLFPRQPRIVPRIIEAVRVGPVNLNIKSPKKFIYVTTPPQITKKGRNVLLKRLARPLIHPRKLVQATLKKQVYAAANPTTQKEYFDEYRELQEPMSSDEAY